MTGSGHRAGPAIALAAALLWGLWWIPIRELEEVGLPGAWAGVAMNLGAAPLLLLWLALTRNRPPATAMGVVGAALIGAGMMLYAAAITETEIVRAVLLFYLAPAWSIAIECLFFGRRFRPINILAFALAIAGVALIFRGEVAFENWSVGDVMAVASGFLWAVGAALLFARPGFSVASMSLAACLAATLLGAVLTVALDTPSPAVSDAPSLTVWALLTGALYLAPVVIATLWSAGHVAPATLSFLLTAEIISGVGSSALLLDEPFGAFEIAGATLIAMGATLEVFLERQTRPGFRRVSSNE